MAVDQGLWQHLNLLRSSPSFVLTERESGQLAVSNPPKITPDMGVVWLFAETTLSNRSTFPSVVVLDTTTGGPERALYLWIADAWYEPAAPADRADILCLLSASEDDLFPYRWTSQIPLALG